MKPEPRNNGKFDTESNPLKEYEQNKRIIREQILGYEDDESICREHPRHINRMSLHNDNLIIRSITI